MFFQVFFIIHYDKWACFYCGRNFIYFVTTVDKHIIWCFGRMAMYKLAFKKTHYRNGMVFCYQNCSDLL